MPLVLDAVVVTALTVPCIVVRLPTAVVWFTGLMDEVFTVVIAVGGLVIMEVLLVVVTGSNMGATMKFKRLVSFFVRLMTSRSFSCLLITRLSDKIPGPFNSAHGVAPDGLKECPQKTLRIESNWTQR